MDTLITSLKKVGFTEYESKIYLTLLESHPMIGNLIAKESGVPGAKVYGCLSSMVDKGFVSIVYSEGKSRSKVMYSPTPYDQILNKYYKEMKEEVSLLKSELKKVVSKNSNLVDKQQLYQITDYEVAIEFLKEMINQSEDSIYLCGWKSNVADLYEELLDAFNRNVKIITILFDKPEFNIPWVNFYHLSFDFVDDRHKFELNLVIDENKVANCKFEDNHTFAILSGNEAIVHTTLSYIRHDIYINKMLQDFYGEAIEKYGLQLEKLLKF